MLTTPRALALSLSLSLVAHAAPPPTCDVPAPSKSADSQGNPAFRTAAQRGLEFMSRQARTWTEGHGTCYGCHVHSVTLEGLSIGKHNRYDVSLADMKLMAKMMLNDQQGVHTTTFTTARAFGGVAFARFDQLVDGTLTDDLLKIGRALIASQQSDGSVKVDDTRFPIESGVMQATFQAMQTWRQCYARTANDVWLTPLRKAEEYLQVQAQRWPKMTARAPISGEPQVKEGQVPLQDMAYALMGLTAAGVGSGEKLSLKVQRLLLERQNKDGGWGFRDGSSDAFATGQVLYALRGAGLTEKEGPVARGMTYLVERQQKTGGWGGAVSTSGNSALGEAMWAVMGLVTVDVMTVSVSGLTDGQHVEPTMAVTVAAKDNRSGGVRMVQLLVDDRPVATACGEKLEHALKTEAMTQGKHLVDVVATNAKGETSRRRFEVYAGNVFLTQMGSRFDEGRGVTEVTARDIATKPHAVKLEVFTVDTKDGQPVPGKAVYSTERGGEPGALNLTWDGRDGAQKPQPKGRYFARVTVKLEGGATHTEQVMVFHEREEVQRNTFAEVEGTLSLGKDDLSANTEVELVDEKGRVVQSTRSTAQGNYRFKNVDKGNYKVRAKKEGFEPKEMPVEAKPAAAPATANMGW